MVPVDVAPRLRVVYRSHGGENRKSRPGYYSKLLSLVSLVRAAERVDPRPELVFVNDGPIPDDRLRVMRAAGEVVPLQAGSNRRSYRAAISLAVARQWPARDIVWFAEDDYLYRPDSFVRLLAGAAALRHGDYFSMYGRHALDVASRASHPRQRVQPGAAGDPAAVEVDGVAWFRAMSTTSTFGVRAEVLRADRRLLRTMPFAGGAWDHITCLTYQGYLPVSPRELAADALPFRDAPPQLWIRSLTRGSVRVVLSTRALRRPSHRRVLLGCDPELIAHLEQGAPGPSTDWPALAEDTLAWAAVRGLATDSPPPAAGPLTGGAAA